MICVVAQQVSALYDVVVTGVFGKPIRDLRNAQFLIDWYTYLTKYGLGEEGVFRKSGDHGTIIDLKQRYNRGMRIHLDAPDEVGTQLDGVHIVADLLKTWFRSLPLKLISAEVVEELTSMDTQTEELRGIFIKQMADPAVTPPIFAAVLRQLFDFLHLVAARSGENKMTASNLAVCFTPSLCYITMDQMESADRILKRLAQCLAFAISEPAEWLPISDAMRAVGSGAVPSVGSVVVDAAAGGDAAGSANSNVVTAAVPTGGDSTTHDNSNGKKDTESGTDAAGAHVREDSDLTKMVKSAKRVRPCRCFCRVALYRCFVSMFLVAIPPLIL